VHEEKRHLNRSKNTKSSRSLVLFHVRFILEVIGSRFEFVTRASLANQVCQAFQDDEIPMESGFFLRFARTHKAKERANAPLTKRCIPPTVLYDSDTEDIRRQANPRVAGRLSHSCPGEARGFLRILR